MYSKISNEDLQEAIDHSVSFAGVLRYLGRNTPGGSQSWIAKRIRRDGFDVSHFTGQAWNKGNQNKKRKTPEEILVLNPVGGRRPHAVQLRRALIETGRPRQCEGCGNPGDWNGKFLVLEIDHINSEYWDDRINNLRFLCPNCHSQETIVSPTALRPKSTPANRVYRLTSICKCGNPMSRSAKTCIDCYRPIMAARPRKSKIEWPPIADLLSLLEKNRNNFSVVGALLGVSDNAIRKHIRTRT